MPAWCFSVIRAHAVELRQHVQEAVWMQSAIILSWNVSLMNKWLLYHTVYYFMLLWKQLLINPAGGVCLWAGVGGGGVSFWALVWGSCGQMRGRLLGGLTQSEWYWERRDKEISPVWMGTQNHTALQVNNIHIFDSQLGHKCIHFVVSFKCSRREFYV